MVKVISYHEVRLQLTLVITKTNKRCTLQILILMARAAFWTKAMSLVLFLFSMTAECSTAIY